MKDVKLATETHEELEKVFGTDTPSTRDIQRWFKQFKEGRDTFDDAPRSGQKMTIE